MRTHARRLRLAPAALIATIAITHAHAHAAAPVGSVLFPLTAQPGYFNQPLSVSAGQAVGIFAGSGSNPNHAALWTSAGPVDLHPAQFINSLAYATNGQQQVGHADTGGQAHAILWTSTAASAIDLTPTTGITSAAAQGLSATQQVGYISGPATGNLGHAVIWTGAANTVVDIHPTSLGITGSQAVATDGTHQVGSAAGPATGGQISAILWSGSANSAVLLNPTNLAGYIQSFALGVGGNQQVGWGFNTLLHSDRALLWTGSASSTVDLTPTSLGFTQGHASATNGAQQVGAASTSTTGPHAILWSGTASSAVDLQSFLPASGSWTRSDAHSIDSSGHIYGTADGTFNGTTGTFAVEWVVPEPTSASLLLLVPATTLSRRRHAGKNRDRK